MNKFFMVLFAFLVSFFASTEYVLAQSGGGSSGSQIVLKFWTFTDELEPMAQRYEALNPNVRIEYTIVPNQDYLARLLPILSDPKQAPDVFTGEAAYAKRFVEDGLWADLSDLTSPAELETIVPYTVLYGTDTGGKLRGLSWQAAVGGYYYSRSLAKKYLGSDDPVEIGKRLSSWEDLIKTAKELYDKSNGRVALVNDIEELVVSAFASRNQPWVVDGRFYFDPKLLEAIDALKTLDQEGYALTNAQWTTNWFRNMNKNRNVFLYVLPTWGLHYVLKTNGQSASGDWGLTSGPSSYYWGGTWVGMNSKSSQLKEAWKFLKWMTLDRSTATWWVRKTGDFTANLTAAERIKDTFSEPYLSGQNHYSFFLDEAKKINGRLDTRYDWDIRSHFIKALNSYLDGTFATKEEMIRSFEQDVKTQFPQLFQ